MSLNIRLMEPITEVDLDREAITGRLREPWTLGGVEIPNRVVLAPLAGIGNWFVRLQAKRYGAGLAVSEMVSSFAVHYGNERTCTSCCGSTRTSTRFRCSCSAPTRM